MNLKYRQDDRTLQQFKSDIKHRTAKEKFLMELYKKEAEFRGHDIEVVNHGTDNEGNLVSRATCAADYKVKIDGVEQLLEIKCSPISGKWTFKTYNLDQYVKHSVDILIFWGTNYIDKDPTKIDYENTRFGIISSKGISEMLDTYDPYTEPKFGNKTCIQVLSKDFDMWVSVERLTHYV